MTRWEPPDVRELDADDPEDFEPSDPEDGWPARLAAKAAEKADRDRDYWNAVDDEADA